MKKRSISLFLSLMLAAAGAQAGGLGDAAKLVGAAGGGNATITVGTLTGGTTVDAEAKASGKDSEAMAGGVISATPKGQEGINAKITVGVLDGADIKAKATATGPGSSAYAGGVIAK